MCRATILTAVLSYSIFHDFCKSDRFRSLHGFLSIKVCTYQLLLIVYLYKESNLANFTFLFVAFFVHVLVNLLENRNKTYGLFTKWCSTLT